MSKVIVTRHPALVELLIADGVVPEGTEVLKHASPEAIEGKDVFGVLPLALASLARSITEIPLRLPPELRGVELTVAQMREHAGEPVTYYVKTKASRAAYYDEIAELAREGGAYMPPFKE